MHNTLVYSCVINTVKSSSSVNSALVMRRNSFNSADNFCYICDEVEGHIKAITAIVKKAYHLYFGCKIGDQFKSCAPHICCRKCATILSQ